MRKVLIASLAAALLVGGGVAYSVVSNPTVAEAQDDTVTDDTVTDDTTTQDEATEDPAREESSEPVRPNRGEIVGEVLGELVADGTITQVQADAILDALQVRAEELRAEFEAYREELGESGFGHHGSGPFGRDPGFADALEDGVLDADELAELGENHPLTDPEGPAAEYLEDGQLTQEELDELFNEFRGQRRGRGSGAPFGGAEDPDAEDPDAVESFFSA